METASSPRETSHIEESLLGETSPPADITAALEASHLDEIVQSRETSAPSLQGLSTHNEISAALAVQDVSPPHKASNAGETTSDEMSPPRETSPSRGASAPRELSTHDSENPLPEALRGHEILPPHDGTPNEERLPSEESPPRAASPPHPTTTAEITYLTSDTLIDEERWSWYNPAFWYPVRFGEVFESRYQVMVKLGHGSVSTVWLCRDLQNHCYVTLKVFVTGHPQAHNELHVLSHLDSLPPTKNEGAYFVRKALDSFEVKGQKGNHVCIVHESMCFTIGELRELDLETWAEELVAVKSWLYGILAGLDYLHSEAKVVHTDIWQGNIMMSVGDDDENLEVLVQAELETAYTPRIIRDDRIVYRSLTPTELSEDSLAMICDFGEAVLLEDLADGEFREKMPDLYRAPEIVLKVPWNEKIDMWAFGLLVWDLIEGKHVFHERLPSREGSIPAHLARMVALLGPPPRDFLDRSPVADQFFDNEGNLKDTELNTARTTLADEASFFEGKEKKHFLAFMSKLLQWRPEDRVSASG